MNRITIQAYQLAIFKVDNALHITVFPSCGYGDLKAKDFHKCQEAIDYITSEFVDKFNKLIQVFDAKEIKNPHDNKQQILILILK